MRALLVTHGQLGHCMLESAQQVYGPGPSIDCISNDGLDAQGLLARVRECLGRDEDEVLVFVDVGGGSCGSAARLAADGRPRTWILSGVNLPMVLTYLGRSESLSAEDLVSKILDRALNSVGLLEPPV